MFPFEKEGDHWNYHRPCYLFWDHLEAMIRKLDEMEIQVDLILFHPYDRWGFARMDKEACMIYLGYVVRRLAAYPNVWWSLANEYDTMPHFKLEWWSEFAAYLTKEDSYGHLLSNHNCLVYWDFHNENTTHCCIQDANVQMVPDYLEEYQKPVIFDECCYEGNVPYNWGNISGFELVHRFWTAVVCGGYCTHGETFLSEDEVLWWSKGGRLKGESAPRIGFLRELCESFGRPLEFLPDQDSQIPALQRLKKHPEAVTDVSEGFTRGLVMYPMERVQSFIDDSRKLQGHCGEDVYLLYFGKHCQAVAEIDLPENKDYRVEVIDIWEMTRQVVKERAFGRTVVELPGKEGVAVLAISHPFINEMMKMEISEYEKTGI